MTRQEPRYLGVDLAWGERGRTGVAVLDGSGRLLESLSVRSDDELLAVVERHASTTVVAAVDAPLVVPNESGRRRCEALVGERYGRFHAGAYPANRGNPAFRPRPRGARIAEACGWEIDPAVRPGPGRRVCVEVYPHPAMVALFGLDRVIRYKARRGRDLASLRGEAGRLLDHMERVCGPVLRLEASPRWGHLRGVVAGARRKSELRAVEDELDGIFCAHLAWIWGTAPERLLVLGDVREGYIVVPPPPGPPGGAA